MKWTKWKVKFRDSLEIPNLNYQSNYDSLIMFHVWCHLRTRFNQKLCESPNVDHHLKEKKNGNR